MSASSVLCGQGGPDTGLRDALKTRLMAQITRAADGETLHQSWSSTFNTQPASHTIMVKLAQGIEIVSESQEQEGFFTQKDYYLFENHVYALRIAHEEACLDGKTKRATEGYIFFDGDTPFHYSAASIRMPLAEETPDFSKAKEHNLPLPPGLAGWGVRLTSRAYDLARTFRPGVGRHTFGDWDAWLLKGAPAPGSGEPAPRTVGWRPPEGTLVLPVRESECPDGRYSIGWGYETGPVDWDKLEEPEGNDGPKTPPLFSTKMAQSPLTGELEQDGNFLLNHITGKPIAKLGIHYPGERQRFNHDELLARWSPFASCVVVIVTEKWQTGYGHIAWIKDGRCEGSQDILAPIIEATRAAALKSKHPASKLLRGESAADFCYSLSKILVEDDGSFEALLDVQIPKSDLPGGYFQATLSGRFTPGIDGGPAVLTTRKTTILPYKAND